MSHRPGTLEERLKRALPRRASGKPSAAGRSRAPARRPWSTGSAHAPAVRAAQPAGDLGDLRLRLDRVYCSMRDAQCAIALVPEGHGTLAEHLTPLQGRGRLRNLNEQGAFPAARRHRLSLVMKGSGVRVPASALTNCLLFGTVSVGWEIGSASIARLVEAIWKPQRKAPPSLKARRR